MHSETQLPLSPRKPLLPVWASVPLYLIATVLLMGIGGFISTLFNFVFPDSVYGVLAGQLILWFVAALLVTLTALFFLVYIDRTSAKDLGLTISGRGRDIIAGLAWASVLYFIGFTTMYLLGAVSITEINPNPGVLILSFITFFCASVTEEVMMRGYVQSRLMTRMNKFLALAIASVIFAILHLSNPNIGFFPLINLFLAGIMLGAAYMYTQNLWFPIALHLAWNWIQGPVLGFEVSGTNTFPTMLSLQFSRENIINGGAFGFEGSIICTILMIVSTFAIILWGETKARKI